MKYVGRILLAIFLFVNAVLAVGCAQSFSTSSIPDPAGRYSSITTGYPGVVMVISPGGTSLCTGSIVSLNTVLTATHCVLNSGNYTVRSQHGDFVTSNVVRFGNGSVDDVNDISLLLFDSPVTPDPSEILSIGSQAAVGDAVAVVGFGCTSVTTRQGAGVKRAGTNRIAGKDDYVSLLTPMANTSRVIGDANQAGTCFGDSGGPLLRISGSGLAIVGVTHAGGTYQNNYVSEYTNVADNSQNRSFLSSASREYGLSLSGM